MQHLCTYTGALLQGWSRELITQKSNSKLTFFDKIKLKIKLTFCQTGKIKLKLKLTFSKLKINFLGNDFYDFSWLKFRTYFAAFAVLDWLLHECMLVWHVVSCHKQEVWINNIYSNRPISFVYNLNSVSKVLKLN